MFITLCFSVAAFWMHFNVDKGRSIPRNMVEIISPDILQELTPCFKTSYCYIAAVVLIKILFKSDRFFKFQNVVKLSNSFHYKLEEGLIFGGKSL